MLHGRLFWILIYILISLTMPAAIYTLPDIVIDLHTGGIVYVMKRMLVFYVCKTSYIKLLKHVQPHL
jgi:hypothetical protein